MPAFRLDGRKAVVIKEICFLFVQWNVAKNDAVVRKDVKIAIRTGEEGVAWIIPAVPVFLRFFMLFRTRRFFTTITCWF
jgi:hypothetical protein